MWRVAGKGPLRLPAVFLCIAMGMFVTFIGTILVRVISYLAVASRKSRRRKSCIMQR